MGHRNGLTETTADFVAERSLREIHSICNSEDDQFTVSKARPVEKIVHDALILCHKLV